MSYTFRPAVREQTALLLGIAGCSGSGKTLSALRLARGILGGDDGIFVVDTEANRALHYACAPGEDPGPFLFKFQHCAMSPPFSPDAYREVLGEAVNAGARVVIVDSMSHLHEGEGGVLEMHEAELQRMAGNDYGKRERMKFAAWISPKAANGKLVNWILQQKCNFIFCFRAKDKMKLIKNAQGKMEPVQLGWTPICSDRFEYEMTSLLMLPPTARGVPDLNLEATKINAHHVQFFPAGKPIDEAAGKALARWAAGGAKPRAEASSGPTGQQVFEPPKPPASVLGDDHQRAMRSVHAAAKKEGISHEDLTRYAFGIFGHTSLSDCSVEELRKVYGALKDGAFRDTRESEPPPPGDDELGFDPNENLPPDL